MPTISFIFSLNGLIENKRRIIMQDRNSWLGAVINEFGDDAMKVRNKSRILMGAFGFHIMKLMGKIVNGEASASDYLNAIRDCFTLGYIAVKEDELIYTIDISSGDKMGSLGDEFDNEQLSYCRKFQDIIFGNRLANELNNFLSKNSIVDDYLNYLSQYLIESDLIKPHTHISDNAQGEIAGKLAGVFVLGYVAAKHPNTIERTYQRGR